MTTPVTDPQTIRDALSRAAAAPVLLVACDFDGILSEIASTPRKARADERAVAALAALTRLPHTHAAIISGRALADLREKLDKFRATLGPIRMVGSHGLEFESGFTAQLPAGASELLQTLRAEVGKVVERTPGSLMEVKPASVTFHFREVESSVSEAAIAEVIEIANRLTGVHTLSALAALELSVVTPNKGGALELVRRRVGASAVAFLGDDVTDESVFEKLGEKDVGIRVGGGPTLAHLRLGTQRQVAECLELVASQRALWLAARPLVPIESHAVLSDQRTLALIDPVGGISWLCLPRIDSPAILAGLVGGGGVGVGGEARGSFVVAPAPSGTRPPLPRREYSHRSMVLRTDWGGLTVTDYLDCSGGRAFQRAGRSDLLRVVEGRGRITIRFAPRMDFGRAATRLVPRDGGLEVEGGPDPIALVASGGPGVEWRIEQDGAHQTATAEVDLGGSGGDGRLILELRYGTASLRPSVIAETERRDQTRLFWSAWASSLRPPTLYSELTLRCALAVKAVCYAPTGAIAAAATTSLPEHLGGSRNWDYRYCWPRDAAIAAASLVRMGNTGVAMRLLDWLAGVVERTESPDRLRPLYTVSGAELGPEAEIGDLAGYGDSRPVRVGNAAASQVQLDVFGPIVDLVAMLAERGVPVTPEHWKLVQSMVQAVALRWTEPDHGIWELRRSKRHHVYTKVMCWHAVNRAIAVAQFGMGRVNPEWDRLRDAIAADVLTNGWNEKVGAFTTAYGEPDLDAASLAIGLTGLIPATDPRWKSTIESIERGLMKNGLVYRYLFDDGLAGIEGCWILCTGWMIQAQASIGNLAAAADLLDRLARRCGPLGLMPEEYDPDTGLGLGNYPQAYSHAAFIDAAVCIAATGQPVILPQH